MDARVLVVTWCTVIARAQRSLCDVRDVLALTAEPLLLFAGGLAVLSFVLVEIITALRASAFRDTRIYVDEFALAACRLVHARLTVADFVLELALGTRAAQSLFDL